VLNSVKELREAGIN